MKRATIFGYSAAMIALFFLSFCALLRPVQAEPDVKEAAKEEKPAEAKEADQTKSEEVEEVVDPYEMPEEASGAALLNYVQGMYSYRPKPLTQESMIEHYKKMLPLSEEAMTKALAMDLTDAQKLQAYTYQFRRLMLLNSLKMDLDKASLKALVDDTSKLFDSDLKEATTLQLFMLQRQLNSLANSLEMPEAGQFKESFDNRLKSDTRERIAKYATRYFMEDTAENWGNATEEQKATFRKDLQAFLDEGEPSALHAQLGQTLSYRLMNSRDYETAGEVIKQFQEKLSESENAQIQTLAKRFGSDLKRLEMVGAESELVGQLLDKSDFDWDSYRGKVVLIDFWASWCGPCRAEMPNVLKAYKAYHDKGFEVVGVSLDRTPEAAEKYLSENSIPWVTLYGHAEGENFWQHPMVKKYEVRGIPATFLIDKDGKVYSLSARDKHLWVQLKELLGEPNAVEGEAVIEKTGNQ